MPEQEFEYMSVLERYHYFTGQNCEPVVAAILVLAAALKDAAFMANPGGNNGAEGSSKR